MSSSAAPVVLVDDEGDENGLRDLFQMAVDSRWPGRQLLFYKSLEDAAEIVRANLRFTLILDHNMGAGENADLARSLGTDPRAALFGYHLCAAIRRQHTFGLAIPVAYLTGMMPGDSFLQLLQQEGPFLPNFWVDKNRDWDAESLISELDEYGQTLIANLRAAANSVFLSEVPELDDDVL